MMSYAQDRYHVFKRELKNAENRLRDIGYLEKSGNSGMLAVEKEMADWIAGRLESVEDVCIRFYLYEIYVLKRTSFGEASRELGYQNPSAFIKLMKKSVEPVLTDAAMEEYHSILERERQLLKEGLSETQ